MCCLSLNKMHFLLTAHIQAARALMITGSFLGLPGVFLLLSAMPCIRMGHDPGTEKHKRFLLGGVLIVILGKPKRKCTVGDALLLFSLVPWYDMKVGDWLWIQWYMYLYSHLKEK